MASLFRCIAMHLHFSVAFKPAKVTIKELIFVATVLFKRQFTSRRKKNVFLKPGVIRSKLDSVFETTIEHAIIVLAFLWCRSISLSHLRSFKSIHI